MITLSEKARQYLTDYERDYKKTCEMATSVAELLGSLVDRALYDVHLITSRAKSPDSLRSKLRRKRYKDPANDLTDSIGVRIITYYRDDVDAVVAKLKAELEIDLVRSIDKRGLLDLWSFGYRSVHLIARIKAPRSRMLEYSHLRGVWFEIQVRSLLEHAWAEIEHETVYKSGISYPGETRRQFAAMAGTLEILDREFMKLRAEREHMIDLYRDYYRGNQFDPAEFDCARMLGSLEALWPHGLSWRKAKTRGRPFAPKIEVACLEALKSVKLSNAAALGEAMESRQFKSSLRRYAASSGQSADGVSHLALILLAVVIRKRTLLRTYFPEMIRDPLLQAATN